MHQLIIIMLLFIILGIPVPSWMIPSIINTTPPCYVVMGNFTMHKKDGDRWCSTPFYSGPQGYKMCLRVHANGHKDGAGTHVSVYAQIIQGEYDDTLTWPYTGTVTYEIINWKDDSNHVKRTADFSGKSVIAGGYGNQPTGEDSNKGWGHHQALSHNELYGNNSQYINNDTCIYGSNSQYINNDILCIRVSIVCSH